MMASVLFAAGIFTGIMKGAGMLNAMAQGLVSIIPEALAAHFAVIIGIISMPASLLFDPDSFYFAVLPVLAQAANAVGLAGVDLGRAAISGQMTLGFPISPLTPSTFLLVGLAGVDFGEHQKHTFFWAWLVSLVIFIRCGYYWCNSVVESQLHKKAQYIDVNAPCNVHKKGDLF